MFVRITESFLSNVKTTLYKEDIIMVQIYKTTSETDQTLNILKEYILDLWWYMENITIKTLK